MSDDPNTPPPAEDVSHFPPAMAAERLVKMSAAFKASQPTPGPYGLTPEEANSQLAAMTEAFNKSKQTTLPAADAAVLGGDDRLPYEAEVTTWPEQNIRNKLSVVDELRKIGIPDEGITKIIAGKSYSQADYDAAVAWRERVTNDPVLRKELLDGSSASRHVITAMSAIIALGPAEVK
jgi:hypothetical protein